MNWSWREVPVPVAPSLAVVRMLPKVELRPELPSLLRKLDGDGGRYTLAVDRAGKASGRWWSRWGAETCGWWKCRRLPNGWKQCTAGGHFC